MSAKVVTGRILNIMITLLWFLNEGLRSLGKAKVKLKNFEGLLIKPVQLN